MAIFCVMARAKSWRGMTLGIIGLVTGTDATWATEICDCFNWEKTSLTNEKKPPVFMAGGVLLAE
jgi:hypothetical protein